MNTLNNNIFFPVAFSEIFSVWKNFPKAVLYAGGTDLIRKQGKNIISLPNALICLDKLEELRSVTRTEQYLEIGPMVTLNKLTRIGKIIPDILCTCINGIGGVQLRNTATIGGNICSKTHLHDLSAMLVALDAQYEFRSADSARWVSSARFHSAEERKFSEHEFLSRIRLPLYQWDYSIYKKIGCLDPGEYDIFVFLARAKKNILLELKTVYKTKTIIRNKNAEELLNGKSLPLSRKIISDFLDSWKEDLSDRQDESDFSKNAFLSSIEENILVLSE